MEWIQPALCLLLGALAILDQKDKKIPVRPIAAVLCMGVLHLCLNHYKDWESMLGGAGVGVVIYLLSKITNKQIGAGDGLVIGAIGIFAGVKATLFCTFAAFFFASFAAIFLILVKKAGKKYKMAFIPYIFAAYALTICMQTG